MSEFLVCHWSDLTKPLYHQTKHQLVVRLKQAKINIWNWALKATILFYKIFYDKEHISPPGKNTCERNSLSLPGTHFVFLILPFSKFRTQSCSYCFSVPTIYLWIFLPTSFLHFSSTFLICHCFSSWPSRSCYSCLFLLLIILQFSDTYIVSTGDDSDSFSLTVLFLATFCL